MRKKLGFVLLCVFTVAIGVAFICLGIWCDGYRVTAGITVDSFTEDMQYAFGVANMPWLAFTFGSALCDVFCAVTDHIKHKRK